MENRRYKKFEPYIANRALVILTILLVAVVVSTTVANGGVTWQRKSSTTGDIPIPNAGNQQTCCMV
ncbi:MAG: hypothetical protein U9Q07_09155, partial [Planctomycetota bacterium]|nr:hypothetical protein [Planctomycetota bacterium]